MFRLLQDKVIMIVDDMPLNLIILEQVLQSAGANVVKAANGKEALKLLDNNSVEIILTDLQMPEMDGWEMTACIRQSNAWYRQLPIIATTSETEQPEIQKCFALGMNEVLNKPIDPATICQKIVAVSRGNSERFTPTLSPDHTADAFSLSYLTEVTNGDEDSLLLIIDNLKENAPLLLERATDMVRIEKWGDVAVHLHKLKGLVTLFQMNSIVTALKKVEQEAKGENPDTERVLTNINCILVQLAQVIRQISLPTHVA